MDSALFRVLERLGLRPLESIASLDGRQALVCARYGQASPYCIALAEGTRILRTFPEVGDCELVVCPSKTLLGGTDLLFANALCDGRFVGLLSLKSGELHTDVFNDYLGPDFNESQLTGLDVDATGRYGLIAWQWDDFPQILIVDAQTAETFQLDATDLIDAPIDKVRWHTGASAVLCFNPVARAWITLPVDLTQRRILWQPQPAPAPPDFAAEDDVGDDESDAPADAPDGEPFSAEQADAIRAAGWLTIDKLSPEIVAGYKRMGYSEDEIQSLARMIALSDEFKLLGAGHAARIHRLFLTSVWKPLFIAMVLLCVPFVLPWRGMTLAANVVCLLAGLTFLIRAQRGRIAKRVLADVMKTIREAPRPGSSQPADRSNKVGGAK